MENKFDTGDLFTNGENHRGKTSPGEFKVTTPKNPQLSITSGYKYNESVGKFRPRLIELISFKPKLLIKFIMNKLC